MEYHTEGLRPSGTLPGSMAPWTLIWVQKNAVPLAAGGTLQCPR